MSQEQIDELNTLLSLAKKEPADKIEDELC